MKFTWYTTKLTYTLHFTNSSSSLNCMGVVKGNNVKKPVHYSR